MGGVRCASARRAGHNTFYALGTFFVAGGYETNAGWLQTGFMTRLVCRKCSWDQVQQLSPQKLTMVLTFNRCPLLPTTHTPQPPRMETAARPATRARNETTHNGNETTAAGAGKHASRAGAHRTSSRRLTCPRAKSHIQAGPYPRVARKRNRHPPAEKKFMGQN